MPTTSFIISAYNAERFLPKTLESCFTQTVLPDKILVADDGSTDKTRKIIEGFHRDHPEFVIPFLSDHNEGKAIAINRLIDALTTDYALIIDSDDIAFSDRVEKQVGFMEGHPGVDISCSFVRHIDETGKIIGNGVLDILSVSQFQKTLSSNEAIGLYCPATIIRRSVFLDPTLRFRQAFWPAEDIDLWNRAAEKGHVIVVQPEFLTGYRIHAGSAVTSSFKTARLKYEYARDCLNQRRHGESELPWEAFLDKWNSRPWHMKFNTWRKTEAKRRYRSVAAHLSGSRYFRALLMFLTAALLQPSYAFRRAMKQIGARCHAPNNSK